MKLHKKDQSSRRGLLKMVGRRSALLKYLSGSNHERYVALISRLGLRK
jgi:small subunit ribosomal protein S15